MFQTMCAGCDFPIEPGDRWVEAMSKNFHAECFNCSVSHSSSTTSHAHTQTCMHVHTHTQARTRAHTHTSTCTHAHTQANTHTHMRTHAHTDTGTAPSLTFIYYILHNSKIIPGLIWCSCTFCLLIWQRNWIERLYVLLHGNGKHI